MGAPRTIPGEQRVAAVDLGSNGIRCLAVAWDGRAPWRVLLQERAPVRLGDRAYEAGRLDDARMDEACTALAALRGRLDHVGVAHVRAVATSAVRDSANAAAFLSRAGKALGVPVVAVTAAEEARLVHGAVAHAIGLGSRVWGLVDLGGGSVQLSAIDAAGLQATDSFPLGAVRLLGDARVAGTDLGALRLRLAPRLAQLRWPGVRPADGFAGLLAAGGNIEDLARIGHEHFGTADASSLPVATLATMAAALAALEAPARMARYRLRPDRADVIVPAALVYEHVARLARAAEILVPRVGVKEGLVWGMLSSDDAARHLAPT